MRSVEEKGYWFGPEVEGVLKAARPFTAIIRRPPEDPRLVLSHQGRKTEHVFLTEEFDAWEWLESFLGVFDGPVTVGCHAKDVERLRTIKSVGPRLRVIARYWSSQVADLLSPEDEISVGEPFDLIIFQVGNGVRTTPEEYEEDEV